MKIMRDFFSLAVDYRRLKTAKTNEEGIEISNLMSAFRNWVLVPFEANKVNYQFLIEKYELYIVVNRTGKKKDQVGFLD